MWLNFEKTDEKHIKRNLFEILSQQELRDLKKTSFNCIKVSQT